MRGSSLRRSGATCNDLNHDLKKMQAVRLAVESDAAEALEAKQCAKSKGSGKVNRNSGSCDFCRNAMRNAGEVNCDVRNRNFHGQQVRLIVLERNKRTEKRRAEKAQAGHGLIVGGSFGNG